MGQGGGCGLCYVKGQPKEKWTCPCGRGYWDAVKQKFISGDLVGRGEAPTRADYEAHLRQCQKCNDKAKQDDLILPILDQGEWDTKGYGMGCRPFVEQLPAQDLKEYFLPDKDIKFAVIENNVTRYLGPDASVRRGLSNDGRPGFLIRARFPLTVTMIANLKADSKPGCQEANEPGNARIAPLDATHGSNPADQAARVPSLPADRSPQRAEQGDLTVERVQEDKKTR